jgi:hypothetical protein
MTYCRETRDKKNAMRERVNLKMDTKGDSKKNTRSIQFEVMLKATAPYLYGSILLSALKSKIIVVLTFVYKNSFHVNNIWSFILKMYNFNIYFFQIIKLHDFLKNLASK